ncbi:MAG: helix-turn-helix domain-containing protein [Terriglobales bacterium]|jgi:excisionase family DNA binding protein
MASNAQETELQQLNSQGRVARRWDVSKDTIYRLIATGALRSVTIGARRLIPRSEIERAELVGIGTARKRRTAVAAQQV